MLAICSTAKLVVFKAPKPSSNAERVPQGTKRGAQPRHKNHLTSSKQPSVSSCEETKGASSKAHIGSKIGHLNRKKESSLAMDSNPSQTSASTPVSASGNDASAVSIAEADPGKSAPIKENEASRTIKLEDLAKVVSSVQPSFKDLDSPEDGLIIIVDDSDEDEEVDDVHATTNAETEDTSVLKSSSPKAQPFFPNIRQLNELLVKSLQTEFSKILSTHDFSSSLPTELKELPSKFNELAEEEDFTKTVTSLTSQFAKRKTLQWELLEEFLSVPTHVETIQAKLKTLDALPSLLHQFTYALNQFAQAIASKKTEDDNIPSAGQVGTQPAEGEKNTNQATIS
ncbi:hypothetical protein Tco_0506402 [Tanacetum coccineum]